jgi:hypothetical protein
VANKVTTGKSRKCLHEALKFIKISTQKRPARQLNEWQLLNPNDESFHRIKLFKTLHCEEWKSWHKKLSLSSWKQEAKANSFLTQSEIIFHFKQEKNELTLFMGISSVNIFLHYLQQNTAKVFVKNLFNMFCHWTTKIESAPQFLSNFCLFGLQFSSSRAKTMFYLLKLRKRITIVSVRTQTKLKSCHWKGGKDK